MKKFIGTLLQFLLFLVVFGVFSLLSPFHVEHVLGSSAAGTRIFIADGLILTVALYAVILLVAALRKRLVISAPWTSLAFMLAVVAGLMMKFGFLTR
jgi:hypothetical protein